MFKIKKATGGYGKTTIIRDVSIEVGCGEIVALLGRNGVGKTTVMRYATGLISPIGGHLPRHNSGFLMAFILNIRLVEITLQIHCYIQHS